MRLKPLSFLPEFIVFILNGIIEPLYLIQESLLLQADALALCCQPLELALLIVFQGGQLGLLCEPQLFLDVINFNLGSDFDIFAVCELPHEVAKRLFLLLLLSSELLPLDLELV